MTWNLAIQSRTSADCRRGRTGRKRTWSGKVGSCSWMSRPLLRGKHGTSVTGWHFAGATPRSRRDWKWRSVCTWPLTRTGCKSIAQFPNGVSDAPGGGPADPTLSQSAGSWLKERGIWPSQSSGLSSQWRTRCRVLQCNMSEWCEPSRRCWSASGRGLGRGRN